MRRETNLFAELYDYNLEKVNKAMTYVRDSISNEPDRFFSREAKDFSTGFWRIFPKLTRICVVRFFATICVRLAFEGRFVQPRLSGRRKKKKWRNLQTQTLGKNNEGGETVQSFSTSTNYIVFLVRLTKSHKCRKNLFHFFYNIIKSYFLFNNFI